MQTASQPGGALDLPDLERAVSAADPAVVLVAPRILRRVIKQECQLRALTLRVPHRKSYVISRDRLLEICQKAELDLAEGRQLPPQVILISRPHSDRLAAMTPGEMLLRWWRLVFHARVHWVLQERIAQGKLTAADVRQRIHQIGAGQFGQIRAVLHQEDLLLARDEVSVYVELAAVYLELRYFAPGLLPYWFPSIEQPEQIEGLLGQDVDAEELFRSTRPEGAPDPQVRLAPLEVEDWPEEGDLSDQSVPPPAERPSAEQYRRWVRKAEKAAAAGNLVRSAICRVRSERVVPVELAGRARAALKGDINRLVQRLLAALEVPESDPRPWREILLCLALEAPRGIWGAEARLLYDLQKVCVDHERDIYTVDVVEWVLSLGRRRVKRPLPRQRDVLMCRHLRSAARKLARVRLSDSHRFQLSSLIRAAQERTEGRLREHFRPLLVKTLDEVGLRPQNLPERVARAKIVEELLDRIAERGFLTIGDLRDALSRNNLKLPDVAGLRDFLRGDPLLRSDFRLANSLDGVYGRAEFYLRWLQQLSSLAFGTKTGRLLTRYVAVPFGGAYLVLAGLEHLVHWVHPSAGPPGRLDWIMLWQVFQLGVFLLGVLNFASFRRATGRVLKSWWQAAREGLAALLRSLAHWPPLERLLRSRLFALSMRYLVKPLALATLAWWGLLPHYLYWWQSAASGLVLFIAAHLLLNSRLGRDLEELVAEGLVQAWRRIGLRILSSLFLLVMDLFKRFLLAVERLLYAVDEWLRFKSGQTRLTLISKAVLGVIWFYVTYIIRFGIVVLIEPQINPIKHFPVVTVSHKLLWAAVPYLASVLHATMADLAARLDRPEWAIDKLTAIAVVTSFIWCVPGVFGFLVWELKENWRLYAANRPDRLIPVRVGHHGESMARLLRPGFWSGTIPKRYAKLRRALRKALAKGKWRPVRKHLEALRHTELAIRRYLEREFLALFCESRAWRTTPVRLEEVRVAGYQVKIALGCRGIAGAPLWIAFEVQSGWLTAGIAEPGWISRLDPQQLEVLRTALIGLYKLGAVELVRQQIEAELPPPTPVYELADGWLVVWPDGPRGTAVRYPLRSERGLIAPVPDNSPGGRLPAVDRRRLVFRETPVLWRQWVDTWEEDRTGRGHRGDLLPPVRVLPVI
ncbi:MAG: hypothetical protein ACUVUC_01565 [Thermoguttaceae bacterium]